MPERKRLLAALAGYFCGVHEFLCAGRRALGRQAAAAENPHHSER
jgi:hypothetical protein